MNILLILIAAFVFLVGLSDIIHTVKLNMLNSGHKNNKVLLCVLTDESAELDLQFIIEQSNWLGKKYSDKILCVNRIKSLETLNICQNLANKNNIKFILDKELASTIESEL